MRFSERSSIVSPEQAGPAFGIVLLLLIILVITCIVYAWERRSRGSYGDSFLSLGCWVTFYVIIIIIVIGFFTGAMFR